MKVKRGNREIERGSEEGEDHKNVKKGMGKGNYAKRSEGKLKDTAPSAHCAVTVCGIDAQKTLNDCLF